MAATGTATKSGLASRMTRLPGEVTLYDPDTGVYFNPYNGHIENFSTSYSKLPGENLYYKVGAGKMYFDPYIYSQFITSTSPKLSGYVYSESSSGFTLYVGPAVDLGGGIGGGVSGGLALSYNSSNKTWTVSSWGAVTGSEVAGVDNQAGVVVGFVGGNETTLGGWSMGGSVNVPVGDLTIAASGQYIDISLKVAPGPAAGVNTGVLSYTVSKRLITVRSFFR